METAIAEAAPKLTLAASTGLDWVKALANAVRLVEHKPGFETKGFHEERMKLVAEVLVADAETRRVLEGEPTHEDMHRLARVWDKFAADTQAMMKRHGMKVR